MRRFPSEFADLLNRKGQRLLAEPRPSAGEFISLEGLIAAGTARAAARLLDHTLTPLLRPMEAPIPQSTITAQRRNYEERLPKSVRASTLLLASTRSKAWLRAQDIGLIGMMRSESMRAFAQGLVGAKLRSGWGVQVLCYRPGDYSGPHTDHHPEDAAARDGYVDLHVTLCNDGVAQQLLVYARDGHFTEQVDCATRGGITCYRLPFWHYTTPLQAKRGQALTARRWLLLSTFLYA